MRYVSTRGAWAESPQPFCAILREGLAPDGGLAVPQMYPRIAAELPQWRALAYPGLAFAILSRFIDDIPPDDLKALIDRTYTAAIFGSDDITRILADLDISIDAMIQKEPPEGEDQTDIIMLTHLTIEKNVDAAILGIEALPTVTGNVVRIRLENLA